MALVVALAAVFAAALVAPALIAGMRRGPQALAVVPLALTVYFLTQIPTIEDGRTVEASYTWVESLQVHLALRLDGLSLLFALLISGIGFLVVVYSGSYMQGQAREARFYALLFLFMGSMLGLVLADDLIVLFVFWELTSISSFGLISLQSESRDARDAALQALLITSGGGLAMLAGFVLLGSVAGTQSVSEILSRPDLLEGHSLYLPILALVLAGAFTKSAQFPFHFWLPNAMAAPTPVSAYLHSATMVKAGIYLLARLSPVLSQDDIWFYTLAVFGSVTMVLGALLAMRETDLKRILAYATVSALGTLTLLLGVGTEDAAIAAIVFLIGHALYKAALFLVAGIIDHETGTREIDALGGLAKAMPFTAAVTWVAAASMAGVPLLLGFMVKEISYESLQHSPELAVPLLAAAVVANALLAAVALRVALRPFLGAARFPGLHEAPAALLTGPAVLGLFTIGLGLFPGLSASNIVGPAASAIEGMNVEVSLYLWHGLNVALLLSAVTLAGAVLLHEVAHHVRRTLVIASERLRPVSPEVTYNSAIGGLNYFAPLLARLLQHGYLRIYLATVMAAALCLIAVTFATRAALAIPSDTEPLLVHGAVVSVVILAGALLAAASQSRVAAAVSLGMVGYGVALMYLIYGAPDVAMTQILIETLTVLLLVFSFYRLPRFVALSTASTRIRDMVVAGAAGVTLTVLLLATLTVPKDTALSETFASTSKPLAHGKNVVNTILVDFRALDTLGEITVLGVAALGVVTLLRLAVTSREQS